MTRSERRNTIVQQLPFEGAYPLMCASAAMRGAEAVAKMRRHELAHLRTARASLAGLSSFYDRGAASWTEINARRALANLRAARALVQGGL